MKLSFRDLVGLLTPSGYVTPCMVLESLTLVKGHGRARNAESVIRFRA